MDKKIYINGVNVSECSYAITPKRQCPNKPMPYAKETSCIGCKEHNTKLNFCKNNPNCYYKQLQRLKEELRTDKIYSSQIEELEESLQHVKAENERIKGICAKYKMANREWAINYEKLQDRYTKLLELTIQQEQKRIITNYEKIKQMSIDEMADFLPIAGEYCEVCRFYRDTCVGDKDCKEVVKQWLQQESEG